MVVGWGLAGVLVLGLIDRIVFGHQHLQAAQIDRLLSGQVRALPRALGFLGGYLFVGFVPLICGLVVGPLRHRGAAVLVLVTCVTGAGWIATEFRPYGLVGGPPETAWREITSADGHFTVSMPGEPQVRELLEDSSFGPVEMEILTLERGETMLSIIVERYPEGGFFDREAAAILEYELDRMVRRWNAHVAEQTVIEHRGLPALAARLVLRQRGMTFTTEGRVVVGPDRVYRLTASAGDDETRAELAQRFFESLSVEPG
jgi:hypothetical protein